VDEAPGRLKLVFIGNLIPRKGLKTLLDAVDISVSKGALITLEVYGPGDRGTVDAHGGFAYYCGQIPFGQSQNVIRNYDLLVVPSLHDGWAVVVNEALLQGIPVICSDAVGARVLVEASGAGQTFAASDADALASLLLELSQQPEKLKKWRLNAERFSDSLSPQVAAQYQMDCLDFITGRSTSRPSAPWYA
jgi:glycosyltransferase involved in cell wall biosynthesis